MLRHALFLLLFAASASAANAQLLVEHLTGAIDSANRPFYNCFPNVLRITGLGDGYKVQYNGREIVPAAGFLYTISRCNVQPGTRDDLVIYDRFNNVRYREAIEIRDCPATVKPQCPRHHLFRIASTAAVEVDYNSAWEKFACTKAQLSAHPFLFVTDTNFALLSFDLSYLIIDSAAGIRELSPPYRIGSFLRCGMGRERTDAPSVYCNNQTAIVLPKELINALMHTPKIFLDDIVVYDKPEKKYVNYGSMVISVR
jgi:hypothetical protein